MPLRHAMLLALDCLGKPLDLRKVSFHSGHTGRAKGPAAWREPGSRKTLPPTSHTRHKQAGPSVPAPLNLLAGLRHRVGIGLYLTGVSRANANVLPVSLLDLSCDLLARCSEGCPVCLEETLEHVVQVGDVVQFDLHLGAQSACQVSL